LQRLGGSLPGLIVGGLSVPPSIVCGGM
jgi:hypothetical protein